MSLPKGLIAASWFQPFGRFGDALGPYPGTVERSILNSAWRRLLTTAITAGFALLLLLDVVLATPHARWPLLGAGLLTAGMIASSRPLVIRAGVGATVSWLVTGWFYARVSSGTWGLAESAALLLLVVMVSRSMPARTAAPCLVALCGAIVVQPLRLSGNALLFSLFLTVAMTCALAVGGSLRLKDQRRERDLHAVRQDERLNLARELHDFVAHHVTGIIVQAQAARVVAAHDPAAVTGALQSIERAGTEALGSMRQLVGVLRGEHALVDPGGDIGQLRELVEGFSRQGPVATLELADDVEAAALPAPLVTTVHRIVQESLTNVRRHATGATSVRVTVDLIGDRLHVDVRDDGHPTTPRSLNGHSGFGLVGLTERLDSLGGTLRAGPRPEGGWAVLATLPVPRTTA